LLVGEGSACLNQLTIRDSASRVGDELNAQLVKIGARQHTLGGHRSDAADRLRQRAADALAPKGSGIGLSLCKFLIERAGGTITVESRIPGDYAQGTAFLITLPSA